MKRMPGYKNVNWKVLFAVMAVLIFAIFFDSIMESKIFEAVMAGDIQYIRDAVSNSWLYAYLFMLFIMVIQNSFTVIPLILVITINIALFGFLKGFLWSWFTSVIAGILIFLSVRYFFSHIVSGKISGKQLSRIEEKGFAYIFSARVMPLIPTSLINILGGLSSIRLYSFMAATALGNFIYFFLLALVPAGIISSGMNNYLAAGMVIVVLSIFYCLGRFRGRKDRKISPRSVWFHR